MSRLSTWWRGIVNAIKSAFTWTAPKPEPQPKTDPKPDPVETEPKCTCDLSKPLAMPPYTAQQLKDLGNAAECPVPFGMDIRLKVFKPDGSAWQIGMLFREGLVTPVTSRSWLAHCVDFDGGRYHFIGWSTSSNPESIVRTSPEVEVHYIGTMFAWFEFRK